jgi:hypothetical protein
MSNGPNILLKYFVIHGNTLQTASVLRTFFQDFSTILAKNSDIGKQIKICNCGIFKVFCC